MSFKLQSFLLLGAILLFSVGCQPKQEEVNKMPEIPPGLESKPGFGGMGSGDPMSGGEMSGGEMSGGEMSGGESEAPVEAEGDAAAEEGSESPAPSTPEE